MLTSLAISDYELTISMMDVMDNAMAPVKYWSAARCWKTVAWLSRRLFVVLLTSSHQDRLLRKKSVNTELG